RGGGGPAGVEFARRAQGQPDPVPYRGDDEAAGDPDGDAQVVADTHEAADGDADVPVVRVRYHHAAHRDSDQHRDRDAHVVPDADHVRDPDRHRDDAKRDPDGDHPDDGTDDP